MSAAKEEAPKKGAEQFQAVGEDPSLDMAMRKDPREITDDDLEAIVAALRRERAFVLPPAAGKG